MLAYKEFKEVLKALVQVELGDDVEVYFSTIKKNNGQMKEGITFRERGKNCVPIVHLKELYDVYLQNENIQHCVDFVLEIAQAREQVEVQTLLGTWEEKQPQISIRLINREKNQKLLQTLPHRNFLDLSVVYHMMLQHSENGTATILINNQLLEYWGIDEIKLWETAMQNLNNEEFTVQDMGEIIAEVLDEKEYESKCFGLQYVITNKNSFYGAVSMLRTDLLMELAEKSGMNFFVLPSSVNEIICVPDMGTMKKEFLQDMVQEVNKTQVRENEILSDSLYYFDREKGVVEKLE